MPNAPIPKFIGATVRRREDPALITGQARFVADIRLERTAHLSLVRSPMAHARIVGADASRAQAIPGVLAVISAEDIESQIHQPLPVLNAAMGGKYLTLREPGRFPLAARRVRFAGEAVAAVVAETPEAAIEGGEAVDVEYEPLAAVGDVEKAMQADAPTIHPQEPDNLAFHWLSETQNVDHAFQQAEETIEVEFSIGRLIPNPMEPRAALARYQPESQNFTLWSTTQIPHLLRQSVADILGLEAENVRVIAPEVGGGFGAKANIYPEEVLVSLLSRHLQRPVRWVATRSEDFVATSQGRAQHNRIRLAADGEGKVLAVDLQITADCGAYYTRVTPAIAPFTGVMSTGVYSIAEARAEARGVFTNKPPVEPYRGAGRPEAAYMIERAMDVLALRLGIDAAEVRRRNLVGKDEFPYRNALGLEYDSGDYAGALERLLKLADYPSLRQRQQERLSQGGSLLGLGLACYVEICGFGPWEFASTEVKSNGNAVIRTGTSPHGQGHHTTWAQIAADILQLPLEKIEVRHGDTQEVPRGIGTFGSRSAAVGGSAVWQTSEQVRGRALQIASHLLEASVDDIRLKEGHFQVVGAPSIALSWQTIAEAAESVDLPPELQGKLQADLRFAPQGETYPFGAHLCVVEVDPETGMIEIVRYLTVDDCGKVINPLLVEGQVQGGIAQGIGQALLEEAFYDNEATLLSGTLMDYALPRADSFPTFECHRRETPSPLNPLGVKGIGEAATIGSTPAVVNAVVDALSHLGVEHLDMPLTPEKIWRVIQRQGQG